MTRRLAAAYIVVAAALASMGVISPANAATVGTSATASTSLAASTSASASFVSRINADRTTAGRAAYAARGDLAALALRHSQKMAARASLHHNGALAGEVTNWRAIAENVGTISKGGTTAALHAAFMKSPVHRDNILHRNFTEVGIGVATDARGGIWVTQVFRQPAGIVRTTAVALR